ncbi:siderophore biosynthesis regulatory protein [Candidatus Symbiothrix dinenymphae]|nr:siderophore biosynthesis regulatory protein [Candidatus Symbiothrix dinenymphae]
MPLTVAPITQSPDELLAQLTCKASYVPFLEKMSEHRQREWLTCRVALKELLGEEKEIAYTEFGKPYLTDKSNFISFSHTKGYVAVIASREHPVAIDIEYISPRVEKIRTRFMSTQEEQNLSTSHPTLHLLLHWSAKETLFKLLDAPDTEFKSQLHIHPFEPVMNEWGTFSAHETRTNTQQEFVVHYFVTDKFVVTMC